MSGPFDPYRKWLGIPPEDQPPNHYRLLGIEPLEPDPEVIANAADGRMAQIKRFQIGRYSGLSQRILNEIAVARLCLLSPEKKAEYDRSLAARLEAERAAVPGPPPPVAPSVEPVRSAEPPIPVVETSSVFTYVSARDRKRRSRKRRNWRLPVALAAGVFGIAVLSILVLGLPKGEQPGLPGGQDGDRHAEGGPAATAPGASRHDEPPPGRDRPPAGVDLPPNGGGGDGTPEEQPPNPTLDPSPAPPVVDPGRVLADLLDPPDPGQPDQQENVPSRQEEPAPAAPSGQPGAEDAGLGHEPAVEPVPSIPSDQSETPNEETPPSKDAARREVELRLREIFKKEIAEATTRDQKVALAASWVERAEEMTADPVARFVLMQFACDKAAEAGELTMAMDVADRMKGLGDIDLLAFKASVLEKASGAARSGMYVLATDHQILDQATALLDEAVAADQLDLAGRFMTLALTAVRKIQDPVLRRDLETREREIGRLKVRFVSVSKALNVLSENPDDADANLTVGRWRCFTNGNWTEGLPLLAKGADAVQADLANQDMAQGDDPVQRMALGERWWDLAKRESGPEQRGIQARAQHWYELALPGLSGLDKAQVEKRLAELAASSGLSAAQTRGVIREGNVALAANKTKVKGVSSGASLLIDGVVPTDGSGLAHSATPCEWTITFDQVYRLREIRFLLYDRDQRYHRYAMAISADGTDYLVLVDRSQGSWAGWQRVVFPPRPVKAIKLFGLYSSEGKNFVAIEFEAYCISPPLPSR